MKKNKFKQYLFLFLIFFSVKTYAQSFDNDIKELSSLIQKAANEDNYSLKHSYVKSFSDLLEKTLKKPNSLSQSFDSIPHIKVLTSNNGVVRVFNWGAPNEEGEYLYYAIIQRRMGAESSPLSDIYVLHDTKKTMSNPEKDILHYPDWFGCLYYEIVEKEDLGKTIYTLLGFDFNNRISHKKYVDVLTFNPQGIPSFGAPIFIENRGGAKSRLIFEYSAHSTLHLHYHADIDKIAFNYLYPIVEEKENDRAYYVPDVFHDGLEFKFGKWMKIRNIPLVKKTFE